MHSLIICENDLIDHYNKNNPISQNYISHITPVYGSSEFTNINYIIQYIKYETDDGPIFKNSKIVKGISFSDITFSKHKNTENFDKANSSKIGSITIEMSKAHYDNYKRTYSRLQSLLAEIMSVVNLLIEIGRQISCFLCEKKMSSDIMNNLLSNKKIKNINIKKYNRDNLYKSINKNKTLPDENNNINYSKGNNCNNSLVLEKSNDRQLIKKINNFRINKEINNKNNTKTNNKVFKTLNYFSIFKSFLCFKDKKTKLINLLHGFVIEDLSIEKILQRIYNLEESSKYCSTKKDYNNCKFNEINKYIMDINNEIENNT